jgi:hypothetical protein
MAEQGSLRYRCKAQIILGQNDLIWGLVSFYARNRFWTSTH